ncbi:inner centromere protein isoform X1 [Ornithorhynchus anatinus]|uniref:inner centromere protein isoform X1 n=1 Tax=Ornithorhynchus anatinus TaxID=9258 RepID=UPI0010A75CE6|nr:inner centromere protein isoform X1 [Ornithorhynchus anatinus]XP_028917056.1 inner centromere protein isoform X1 [Ornithorhynchus anatinus]
MGTTEELMSLFEVSNNKLMEFLLNVENRDLVWLREIEQEAVKMFSSDFRTEPELMPKTPSQKNRRKKKRFSVIRDENRDPTRKRLSKKRNRRQSSARRRQSKEELNKLTLALVGENALPPRVTRSKAALLPESPPVPKPKNLLLPFVEISNSVRRSAELYLKAQAPRLEEPSGVIEIASEDEASPETEGSQRLESVTAASPPGLPEVPEKKASGEGRAASKLKIAKAGPSPPPAGPGVPPGWAADGCPRSPERGRDSGTGPARDDGEDPRTPTGSRSDRRSVRRSLVGRPSRARRGRTSPAEKHSLAAKRESGIRGSVGRSAGKKKAARESAVANRVVCRSYLERLLHKDVPTTQVGAEEGPGEEPRPAKEAEKEDAEGTRRTLRSRNANKIAIGTPEARLEANDKKDSPGRKEQLQEPPQSVRRKRSYKQAVDDLYDGQPPEDDEPSPPKSKAPSPPCLASKVVRPHKTFLHTVQKNQLLMTPTSVSRGSGIKSFIKRNTPQRVDPKCSFVEKERQRLENLRKKNEAEEQRKLKVEEEKRKRLEEMKLKREERLRKVLQARERVEQLEEEKKKRIEQKFAQNNEKNEKAKEERQAEEKAKKKVAAKKMEEAEARRRQEEEARKLKRLQQEEEERRYQEQKKREEEQEKARKIAEAKKLAEQRQAELERERDRQRQREQQLATERELERRREQERIQAERERERQEKERTLRLQKERLQKELEEKKKREEQQRLAEQERQEQERKRKLREEQEKKAKETEATAAAGNRGLNVTVEVQSPVCNSYQMTPQGPKVPRLPKINPNNYGMDLNSDDSTDDESHPRKPIPAWANGHLLSQAVIRQYYRPPDVDQMFGFISNPKLEDIFYQNKPRYHKRTSSAVWHSPPLQGTRSALGLPYGLKKY